MIKIKKPVQWTYLFTKECGMLPEIVELENNHILCLVSGRSYKYNSHIIIVFSN